MTVNEAITKAGVVWEECSYCHLPWPFPKGFHAVRDWRCHNCVQALWAALQREMASKA